MTSAQPLTTHSTATPSQILAAQAAKRNQELRNIISRARRSHTFGAQTQREIDDIVSENAGYGNSMYNYD